MNPESSTYPHRLSGACRCGKRHDGSAEQPARTQKRAGRFVKAYTYQNPDRTTAHQTLRFADPKGFAQRQPDGKGGWINNLNGVERVLYRLPELLAAEMSRLVYIVEGEKDADTLAAAGLTATTCAEGAGKWHRGAERYAEQLRGRHVVIIPDNDEPGHRHAVQVARSLVGVAASVKVLDFPDLPDVKGADTTDWIEAGHDAAELAELAAAASEWTPPAESDWFGGTEPSEPAVEPDDAPDSLEPARVTLNGLDSAQAIQTALAEPATVGSLALLATAERGTFEAALLRLRGAGVRTRDLDALSRAVQAATRQRHNLRLLRNGHEAEAVRVRAVLPDAPVPDQAVVPPGWRVGQEAVARERNVQTDEGNQTTLATVAPAPIVLAGRLTYVGTFAEAVRVAWRRDHSWRHHTVDRGAFANARKLVDVAAFGFPVTSSTAGDLVDYLAAFEAANMSALPRARVSAQMGWQGRDGEHGFLWGRTLLRPDGETTEAIRIDETAPADWREDWIAFRGEDTGDEQIVDGYCAAGELSGWLAAVEKVNGYPRVMLGLYSALAAPLLLVVGATNFVVDWAGMTTTGKTTVLRLAASVWGCPDERAPASAISTWDASRVWIERAAAIHHCLPLILDDTKRARNEKLVAQTIYDVVQGRGRGRGSTTGTRSVATWRTILLSSGEQKITDFSEDGGTRVRVLSVWGAPFGAGAADVVNGLNAALLQHYGHAGPTFVRWLLQHRDQWPEWRAEYGRQTQHYQQRAGDDPFAGRLAAPFALLDLATSLAHLAFGWTWGDQSDVVGRLWNDVAAEANEADRAKAALEFACLWAAEHQNQFWQRHDVEMDGRVRTPSAGWAGQWQRDDKQFGTQWNYLAFSRARLESILAERGFEPKAITRLWHERDYTLTDQVGKSTIVVNLAGVSTRMIAIRREVVEAIGLGVKTP